MFNVLIQVLSAVIQTAGIRSEMKEELNNRFMEKINLLTGETVIVEKCNYENNKRNTDVQDAEMNSPAVPYDMPPSGKTVYDTPHSRMPKYDMPPDKPKYDMPPFDNTELNNSNNNFNRPDYGRDHFRREMDNPESRKRQPITFLPPNNSHPPLKPVIRPPIINPPRPPIVNPPRPPIIPPVIPPRPPILPPIIPPIRPPVIPPIILPPIFPPIFPPIRPPIVTPTPPVVPPVPPVGENAVSLAREIFEDLKALAVIYELLQSLTTVPETIQTLSALQQQTSVLATTMGRIVSELSGIEPASASRLMSLFDIFSQSVAFTQNFVNRIRNKILTLQTLINVPDIDRQLSLISTALSNQFDILSTLI